MDYLFSVGAVRGKDSAHIIYPENVARWKRQMKTPYNELSEEEKESDKRQADKALAVIQEQFQEQFIALSEALQQKAEECDKLRTDIAGLLAELTEERQQRIESNALLLATARALDLDADDMGDLPRKAATILAEGSAACQEWSEKCGALQWDYDEAMLQYDMAQKRAYEAEAQAEQTTKNALEANRRWKEKTEALETAIEAGRLFWQEYATLADDIPDDVRGYFRQYSYLAGRFADALKRLEVNREKENRN